MNTTTLESPLTDELLLAREIEICVGVYQSSEARREALANILLMATTLSPTHLPRVVKKAITLTGLGSL